MVEPVIIGSAQLYLGDCREILPHLPKVDACITDPPYGIGEAAGKNASRCKPFGSRADSKNTRGTEVKAVDYGVDAWDDEPIDAELLKMVCDAGRYLIIFGGNYYHFPPSPCWLVWDKENGASDFADCELAWTNLPKAVRRIRYMWNGMLRANGEARGDHPTQKPIGVMAWAINHVPAPARSIIDPFMGSGTTGVAAMNLQRQFIGIEREPKYFEIACRRIEDAQRQARLIA